ncbi:MAG: hypothetical protein KAH48_04175 [Chlorobi bacterium]|nr:hypothetical protein [Chlorobiota bacterium]
MTKNHTPTINPKHFELTNEEFQLLIKKIGHKKAEASRIIGRSSSYISRYLKGGTKIKNDFIKLYYKKVGEALFRTGFTEVERFRAQNKSA